MREVRSSKFEVRRNQYRERQGAELTCLPAIILLAGCAGSVPTGSLFNSSKTQTKPTPSSGPRGAVDSITPATSRITIQGEVVEAGQFWGELADELEEKAKNAGPDEFRTFVSPRAAQWITDKIAETLLFQRAKLRITPPMEKKVDEIVNSELRRIVTANYDGVQRKLERKLEGQGRSLEALREQLRRQMVISAFLEEEVRPKVAEASRDELYNAYMSNIDSWRKPARRSMSLIDVRVNEFLPEGVTEPTREQSNQAREIARQRIQEARGQLQRGAPFSEVAKTHSHGLQAPEGGAWGWVTADAVRERFAPAAAALQTLGEGQVSEIIETTDGFFLVRCDKLEAAVEPDFQSTQPRLRDQFFRRDYNRKIAELVAELNKSARIEPENLEPFHATVVADAVSKANSLVEGAPR